MKFKVGDKVRIVKNKSIWGDTHYGLETGQISQDIVHTVQNVNYVPGTNHGVALNNLKTNIPWWVGIDCLELVNRKACKPSWF